MPRNSAKSAYFHYMVAFKNAEEKRTGRKFSNLVQNNYYFQLLIYNSYHMFCTVSFQGEVADAASENWLVSTII